MTSARTHGRPDFRLYHSNALDVLAGVLATQLAQLPADGDWLRPDVVLVPQYAMRRWLQQVLAERLGICANLRFLTPGEFVDEALARNLGAVDDGERLAPDVLRWHLLRELQNAPPAALATFVADGDPLRRWTLANALAGTFEKYQAWRRDLLQRWEQAGRARAGDGDDWQATLWRRVAHGRAHRARRIGDYLQRFGADGDGVPLGLPPRLFVFACQSVSPDVLQVITSQARAGEQHCYLHTPARAFWGDLRRWAADYRPADDDAFLGAQPNPLLAAWGQAGRDFIAALGSGEAVGASFEAAGFVEPSQDTLLGRMQCDVLDNIAFDADASPANPDGVARDRGWPRPEVDRGDASLQFHACHTRLREVQVLHDQLRALLDAPPPAGDPPLQPRDIAVLAPDIDAYAAHIEAVFGGALGSARELPYTLADTSPLASAALAEAFLRLLELPLRPLTVGAAIDLLAVPAIAARFGLDDGDRGTLQLWLEEAGARWGLDGADRARHGARDDGAYTFEFALDRLLLGYASGSDESIAGIAPWPGLEGHATATLDALLRFLALLREGAAQLAGPHPPAAWTRLLVQLLEGAFSVERDSADAVVLKRLRETVVAFAQDATTAGYAAPVEHAVVLEHLRAALGQHDPRAPFLSGGICFGRMVPMRLIPFRVVCLLGLDDGAFPARDVRDPLNRIVQQLDTRERRVGDPSRRDADRYLFLQLFTSAARVFYLSWCGMDPRDGSEREPSALVSELLDAAVDYHVDARRTVGGVADRVLDGVTGDLFDDNASAAGPVADDDARSRARRALVVRHALQPFSPAAFGASQVDEGAPEPRRFSYDARWHPAASTPAGTRDAEAFAGAALPRREPDGGALSLDRLRSTLLRPHAAFLHEALGLRLPEDEPALAEHEPFGMPDPLARYTLRRTVFDAWLHAGARPDAVALHASLLARALLAPGADGRATLAMLLDEIAPFAECALGNGFTAGSDTLAFEHDIDGIALRGAVDGVQAPGRQPRGVLRVALRPEGLHGAQVLRHGLDRLCASLLGLPLHEIAVRSKGARPQLRTHAPPPDAVARLRALLALRERALREPLPFLPKSGYLFWAGERDRDDRDRALADAAKEWRGDQRRRGEAGPATRLALRGRDPFFDSDIAAREAFVGIARELFAAVADVDDSALVTVR